MPSVTLPSRPNLAQFKIQANELRRAHREGKQSAAARIAAHHPRMKGQPLDWILDQAAGAGRRATGALLGSMASRTGRGSSIT